MAVTIDELHIDVKSGGKQAPEQAPAAALSRKAGDPRQQLTLLAERKARLNTE